MGRKDSIHPVGQNGCEWHFTVICLRQFLYLVQRDRMSIVCCAILSGSDQQITLKKQAARGPCSSCIAYNGVHRMRAPLAEQRICKEERQFIRLRALSAESRRK